MAETSSYQARLTINHEVSPEAKQEVCRGLFSYNVARTEGLLKQPGVDINLVLEDEQGRAVGGVFCDTFLYCLYVDVLWVAEEYRGQGYGAALMREAERIARQRGCTFAHTCTFSYQSPDFYRDMGYEIFGVIDDYPEGIKQFFLKKKL